MDDEEIFQRLTLYLDQSYRKGQRLTGILYLHPITENRERGSDLRNLRMFKKLCGEENFGKIILGITWWDEENDDIARAREEALRSTPEFWGDMIKNGSRVQRVPMDNNGCVDLLLGLARRETTTLRIQREMVDEDKTPDETETASELDRWSKLRAIEAYEEVKTLAQQNLKSEALQKLDQQAAKEATEQKLLFDRNWDKREAEERILREQRERDLRNRGGTGEYGRYVDLEATKIIRRLFGHSECLERQFRLLEKYKNFGLMKQNCKVIQSQWAGFNPSGLHGAFCDHCLIQLPLFDACWSELPRLCLIFLPIYSAKPLDSMQDLRHQRSWCDQLCGL